MHEIETHKEHLNRIFELVLSSPLLLRFKDLLSAQEEQTQGIDSIKACILRCICLLTVGGELFADGSDLKSRLL